MTAGSNRRLAARSCLRSQDREAPDLRLVAGWCRQDRLRGRCGQTEDRTSTIGRRCRYVRGSSSARLLPTSRRSRGWAMARSHEPVYQAPRAPAEPRPRSTVVTSTCGQQLRRLLRGECACGRRPDREISTDPARWQPGAAASACPHACGRSPDRAATSGAPCSIRCAGSVGAAGQPTASERISWDEALWIMSRARCCASATKARQRVDRRCFRARATSMLHGSTVSKRFLQVRRLHRPVVNMSAEAEVFAVPHDVRRQGRLQDGGPRADRLRQLKLTLMWGWSLADGTFRDRHPAVSQRRPRRAACASSASIRGTRTSVALADEHIFIKPSTDAAALIAMAYVIVSEGLHDQVYCDRHVLGFDDEHLPPDAPWPARRAKSHLLGLATAFPRRRNGRPSAPACRPRPSDAWRSSSPQPSPAALHCGYAPGRTAFGEQFHRAAMRWPRSPATSVSSAATPA